MSKVAIYCRVSTTDQHIENQLAVLNDFASKNHDTVVATYSDKGASGAKQERDALNAMLSDARKRRFDCVYVLSIDRLSRSVKHLISTVETLNDLGITLIFHRENIDTKSAMGQFFLTVLGSLAQFEREIMRERINAGIARAKAQGKKMGRKSKINDGLVAAVKLLHEKGVGIRNIAATCQCGVGTVYKIISL